jgi:hypothetical protein
LCARISRRGAYRAARRARTARIGRVKNLEKQAKKGSAPLHLSVQIISTEKFPKNTPLPLLK